jgi:predicted Zn-dependent protease
MKHEEAAVRKGRIRRIGYAFLLALVVMCRPIGAAGQDFNLIRDAEIEATIHAYSEPVFEAADLNADAIDVYLVANDQLNAFVAGGMNMFLFTGLLQKADGPLEVMGVIAHEAGHIANGDLAGRRQRMRESTTSMIASYALGLAAALATGRTDAGLAATQAAQGAVVSNLLSYTRGQEGAADQAAVTYLNRAGYSPKGLLSFMKVLQGQEALLSDNQDPYLRTHPLTQSRINYLRSAVDKSPHTGSGPPERLRIKHERMVAKLDGFLQQPSETLREYKGKTSVPGRYARAIAHYRDADLEKALTMVNGLIEEYPDDPYFHELKGQMLYEHGRIAKALPAYEQAVKLDPKAPLLRLGLARTQVQLNDPALNGPALRNLQRVLSAESDNASAWRLRAIAHGRSGDKGRTAWALAEARLAQGALKDAVQQAERALALLQEHTPPWLRAQDIKREAERRIQQSERG